MKEFGFTIIGISGSLRKASFNSAALRAAAQLLPVGAALHIVEIGDLPLYNEDLRIAGAYPEPVARIRSQIKSADALLIASPEYNLSVTPALKNAIDWVSRPPDDIFSGKPIAIIGAASNSFGTGRSQLHLRQILLGVDAMPVGRPQVLITGAKDKFDADLQFTDMAGRELIKQLLEKLVAYALQLKR